LPRSRVTTKIAILEIYFTPQAIAQPAPMRNKVVQTIIVSGPLSGGQITMAIRDSLAETPHELDDPSERPKFHSSSPAY
jgi:hypothetical protein